jgi:ribosome-associated translation inhibitor RaiA
MRVHVELANGSITSNLRDYAITEVHKKFDKFISKKSKKFNQSNKDHLEALAIDFFIKTDHYKYDHSVTGVLHLPNKSDIVVTKKHGNAYDLIDNTVKTLYNIAKKQKEHIH